MKKYFIFLLCFVILVFMETSLASAQTKTPGPTDQDLKQIEKIKDIVASRVAELKLVEKKGVLGKVTQFTTTQLTLEVENGDKKIVEIDEITKFSDATSKSFGISDVKAGDQLGIIGLFNKSSGHLLARDVDKISSLPEYFDGIVAGVDKKNYQFVSYDESGNKKIIDITPSAKITTFTKDGGQIKSGFTKVLVGQRIHVAGFPDSKVENQLNTSRLIHFPDVPPTDKMKSYLNFEEISPTLSVKPTR